MISFFDVLRPVTGDTEQEEAKIKEFLDKEKIEYKEFAMKSGRILFMVTRKAEHKIKEWLKVIQ